MASVIFGARVVKADEPLPSIIWYVIARNLR